MVSWSTCCFQGLLQSAGANADLHPDSHISNDTVLRFQREKKTLTIKTLMINQKVFYSSFHLGRQTEVDVNRAAQTHTDRQGTDELVQTILTKSEHLFHCSLSWWCGCFCRQQCETVQITCFVMLAVSDLAVPCFMFRPVCIYGNKACSFMMNKQGLLIQISPLLTPASLAVFNMHVNGCIDLAFTPNLDA